MRSYSISCRVSLGLLSGFAAGCDGSAAVTPPAPNVIVTVAPGLGATFAGKRDTLLFTATVKDTLGNPLTDRPVTWTVASVSAFVTITSAGTVSVSNLAPAGDYAIKATTEGVTGMAVVRVLPRPSGRLVFVSTIGGNGQVFVEDFSNDSEPVQVTNGTGSITAMGVDPTTGTIFFVRGQLPNADIYRVQPDGSGLANLTNDPASSNQGPTVNPITHDVFFSRVTGGVAQIFRMRPDGTGSTQVTTGTQNKLNPAISPDGAQLAWAELFMPGFNNEIVTATIGGLSPVRFTDRAGTDANPFWLSGGRLLWVALVGTNSEILGADVPGAGNFLNLTNSPSLDSRPGLACSPSSFTFLSNRAGQNDAYHYDLASGLVVRYRFPSTYSVALAQRLC